MANFDNTSEYYGRKVLKTNLSITGDIKADVDIVKNILKEVLPTHDKNAEEETALFNIYLNNPDWWEKTKETRSDVNNKVSIPTAWALSRTLNGYCFGEPIKYLAKDMEDKSNEQLNEEQRSKQKQVEILSAMLDTMHNHDSTTMATLCASICGLGYKLALPATDEEIEENGVPFIINSNIIYPQLAGVVYSDKPIPQEVLGFLIGTYYDPSTGEKKGNQYTCWTKYAQYLFKESEDGESYDLIKQVDAKGTEVDFYELTTNKIPLIEIERNAFRKGDWEVAKDIIAIRNNLVSSRQDDIQQIIDYVMILINCDFENDSDKNDAINKRLFNLKVSDPQNKPSVEILKNALEQNGIQMYADYLDLLIQETVGVPNRQERGGGGGDTGQAVKYRNGFRDLENNAGLIIPKMDKAELKFLALCIKYCQNSTIKTLDNLKPYEVRCKFMRTLNDDIVSSATAFATYFSSGVGFEDSLIMSKSGTDPSEIAERAKQAKANGMTYADLTSSNSNKTDTTVETTKKLNEETNTKIIA